MVVCYVTLAGVMEMINVKERDAVERPAEIVTVTRAAYCRELWDRVEELAKKNGKSWNWMMRKLLALGLKEVGYGRPPSD